MDQTCFSPSSLAIVSALLTAMAGAVGILHRALVGAKDAQIADLQERLDRAVSITEHSTATTGEVVRSTRRR